MAWLGIRVLPKEEIILDSDHPFVKKIQEAQLKKGEKKSETSVVPYNKDDFDCDLAENCDDGDDYLRDIDEVYDEVDPYENQETSSDFDEDDDWNWEDRIPGSLKPVQNKNGEWVQV